jgi:hypothetical protein
LPFSSWKKSEKFSEVVFLHVVSENVNGVDVHPLTPKTSILLLSFTFAPSGLSEGHAHALTCPIS